MLPYGTSASPAYVLCSRVCLCARLCEWVGWGDFYRKKCSKLHGWLVAKADLLECYHDDGDDVERFSNLFSLLASKTLQSAGDANNYVCVYVALLRCVVLCSQFDVCCGSSNCAALD